MTRYSFMRFDSMAFEEDKQAAKDTLLAPTDKRVDMYRNCWLSGRPP